jgi:hypothetical protein
MRRLLTALMMATGLVLVVPQAALADCGGGYGSDNEGGGTVIGGESGCPDNDDGNDHDGALPGPITGPPGPPPKVYDDYWTPACSANGPPPNGADALCMGAIRICETQGKPAGTLFMQHWRKEVAPGASWEFVGNECRGADAPTEQEPEVTSEMVIDSAYAAAPRPTVGVQPGTRSYVNIPNNYWADAPDRTVTVNVLGNPIAVQFTVDQITWTFGDGGTATGEGVKDADIGAPGAVEHAYTKQGSYTITANSRVGVRFTLPDGQTVNTPGAFSFNSAPVVLPIGEIQTRVDSSR